MDTRETGPTPSDLERGWTGDVRAQHGDWATALDDLKDRVDGNPASRSGPGPD